MDIKQNKTKTIIQTELQFWTLYKQKKMYKKHTSSFLLLHEWNRHACNLERLHFVYLSDEITSWLVLDWNELRTLVLILIWLVDQIMWCNQPECQFNVEVRQWAYLYQLGDRSEQWPWRKWWWGQHTQQPTMNEGWDGGGDEAGRGGTSAGLQGRWRKWMDRSWDNVKGWGEMDKGVDGGMRTVW